MFYAVGIVWTRLVQTLGQGHTFGEIAFLADPHQKRTASVITSSSKYSIFKQVYVNLLLPHLSSYSTDLYRSEIYHYQS